MIVIENFSRGSESLMTVTLEGQLKESQYLQFLSHFESEVRHHKGLKLLFDLDKALRWEARSRWRSLKFDSHHHTSSSQLAVVGNDEWQKWLVHACTPMSIQQIMLFSPYQLHLAKRWLSGEKLS